LVVVTTHWLVEKGRVRVLNEGDLSLYQFSLAYLSSVRTKFIISFQVKGAVGGDEALEDFITWCDPIPPRAQSSSLVPT
jgi:hypothetical protein